MPPLATGGQESMRLPNPDHRLFFAAALFTTLALPSVTMAKPTVAPKANSTPSSSDKAVRQLRLRAEAGDTQAKFALGSLYLAGQQVTKDDKEALKWLLQAGLDGHAQAQFLVGRMCEYGKGIDKNPELAIAWFERAAIQGHAAAMDHLGRIYMDGKGVPQDDEMAIYWLRLSAVQEDRNGQNALGFMFLNGRGVEKNPEVALKWFRRSAEQGNHWAMANVGECLMKGDGAPRDLVEALKWYRLAERHQNPEATGPLRELERQLSPEQVHEADRRVAAWSTGLPMRYPAPWELERRATYERHDEEAGSAESSLTDHQTVYASELSFEIPDDWRWVRNDNGTRFGIVLAVAPGGAPSLAVYEVPAMMAPRIDAALARGAFRTELAADLKRRGVPSLQPKGAVATVEDLYAAAVRVQAQPVRRGAAEGFQCDYTVGLKDHEEAGYMALFKHKDTWFLLRCKAPEQYERRAFDHLLATLRFQN